MKLKIKKVSAFIIASILVLGLIKFYISLDGNPLSKTIVEYQAKEYVEEVYDNKDYQITSINYESISGEYVVQVKSEKFIDEHFLLYYDWAGKLVRDTYNEDVLRKWKVYHRLDEEYLKLVETALTADDFVVDISYPLEEGKGQARDADACLSRVDSTTQFDENGKLYFEPYGIQLEELELNQTYDIYEIGKKAGSLYFWINDEDVSIEALCQHLLNVKEYMDKHNIPFYTISFQISNHPEHIGILYFKYEDIYEEGLEKRVLEAYQQPYNYFNPDY